MPDQTAPKSQASIPDTDDPAVLRELLRQAREQLKMRESIEQMMAENIARTEALLTEARSTPQVDPEALRTGIGDARAALQAAGSALDRLEALLSSPDSEQQTRTLQPDATPETPAMIEVLAHNVRSPAEARSLQQYLAELEHVSSAEVRELAEGMLRITVKASAPVTGESLNTWDTERDRTIRTERADVLELVLED